MSRVHASIEWNDEGVMLIDKSKEGTLLDGKRVKQSKEKLDKGFYQMEIGGIAMSVEIEGVELDETVVDSPSTTVNNDVDMDIHESPVSKLSSTSRNVAIELSDDEFDNVTSISSSYRPTSYKNNLKRKSDASFHDESQPRGKRGPLAQKTINFDEEMNKRGTKGPRARKADDSVIFEDETPAKKSKTFVILGSPVTPEKPFFNSKQHPSRNDAEMNSIVSQVAAIPSVSQESDQLGPEVSDHFELHADRGPAAPTEKIKYANLIFTPPPFQRNQTSFVDPRVPNFKRFVPKNLRGDGRFSAASTRNNTSYNTTIQMVDSRIVR